MIKKLKHLFLSNKEYCVILFLSSITALGTILFYKFVDYEFNDDALFSFTYIKRVISFLSPLSLLGTGVTLIRFIGINSHNKNLGYTITSLLLTFFVPLVIIICNLFKPEFISNIIWSDQNKLHEVFFYPLIFSLMGLNMVSIIISYFRGIEKYYNSVTINLCLIVIIPFVILKASESIQEFILFNGLVQIVFSLGIIFWLIDFKEIKFINIKLFVIESFPRTIGDITFYFLLFAPSYLTFKLSGDLSLTAAVSFCQVLINASVILIKPLTLVKLPWAIKLKNDKKVSHLKRVYFSEIKMVFFGFSLITIILITQLEIIIKYLYSGSILTFIDDMMIFLLLLPFYACFLVSRNYIDGLSPKPLTSFICFFGLVLFLYQIYLFDNEQIIKIISFSIISTFAIMNLIILIYIKSIK